MKRIVVVMIAILGIVSVVNAKLLDVFHPYISVAPAYGWGLKSYGLIDLGDEKSKPFGYDLKAGIDLLPSYFAIEEEYLELKGFRSIITEEIDPPYLFIVNWAVDFKIMISNLKLKYPFKVKNVKISPFFTLGAGYAEMAFKTNYELKSIDPLYTYLTGSSNSKSRYSCYKTGGGIDVETKHFRLSLEYSYLGIKNTNAAQSEYTANILVAGVGYKF